MLSNSSKFGLNMVVRLKHLGCDMVVIVVVKFFFVILILIIIIIISSSSSSSMIIIIIIIQVNFGQRYLPDLSNMDLKIIYKQQIITKI
jgi:hypothetical protein